MPSQRVYFDNPRGNRLAGILDLPAEPPEHFALFAHCFTCTKDLKAIVRVSRGLARHQFGVLRFDFAGLGDSGGQFEESNFETNLEDIRTAAQWLAQNYQAPQLLLGHSLGGAAMMAAVPQLPSARALATLAAPSCTRHLADFLARSNPQIEATGRGEVVIGGRTHMITTQLLESLRRRDLKAAIEAIELPHLVLHSPTDETLAFRHAEEIFAWTAGPKSFITLPDSDHLLVNHPDDVGFVADLIAVWARRWM